MPQPTQITVIRDGLFTSRRLTADINDTVTTAQKLVKEHFGRRPLIAVELVVTSPKKIPGFAAMAQGAAAGIPENVYAEKRLSFTAKPDDLYSVAVIAPKNTIRVLINAKRLRRRPREIGATLVWAFVEIDQLCRKGSLERRIALTRHEMGTVVLPKGRARSLYRVEAEMEAEAAKVTGQIVGKVIRQNRQAEAAAREAADTAATAQNAAA
ncbi:hypothetical protein [Streptomyces erythrochromogenes]|uniref:hypothetical protein n=1 Tax=Streptomyces erythrochromogenes TaxID=285574 RepID=UPI00225644EF|nr:hypothetical protein [Streptomyces erythrochromogenes]MCX5589576.1 hypothetical protein [Streptomyces erythrochromogenes]